MSAHQTLLVDESNTKTSNDGNTKKKQQKSKFYLNDSFIMILLVIVTLSCLILIGLSIFSLFHCYLRPTNVKQLTNQGNTTAIHQFITSTTINLISPKTNRTRIKKINATDLESLGTGRAKYVDDTIHYDYEN